jgi:hypothetical protein
MPERAQSVITRRLPDGIEVALLTCPARGHGTAAVTERDLVAYVGETTFSEDVRRGLAAPPHGQAVDSAFVGA